MMEITKIHFLRDVSDIHRFLPVHIGGKKYVNIRASFGSVENFQRSSNIKCNCAVLF